MGGSSARVRVLVSLAFLWSVGRTAPAEQARQSFRRRGSGRPCDGRPWHSHGCHRGARATPTRQVGVRCLKKNSLLFLTIIVPVLVLLELVAPQRGLRVLSVSSHDEEENLEWEGERFSHTPLAKGGERGPSS